MANKTVTTDNSGTFKTIANLWPYMWPTDRPDLKQRVLWAAFYLVISKLVLMLVPYSFKWATDALNGDTDFAIEIAEHLETVKRNNPKLGYLIDDGLELVNKSLVI